MDLWCPSTLARIELWCAEVRLTLEAASQVAWIADAKAEVLICLFQATVVGKWLALGGWSLLESSALKSSALIQCMSRKVKSYLGAMETAVRSFTR